MTIAFEGKKWTKNWKIERFKKKAKNKVQKAAKSTGRIRQRKDVEKIRQKDICKEHFIYIYIFL